MKLTSYWLDTSTPAGDFRSTPVPERVDVAIVGAGFTGLAAALEIAAAGGSVAVFDTHTVGWGASGRNGGMATTGLAIGLGSAIKRYGLDTALSMFTEYNHAIDSIEDLVRAHSIDCDFERTGKMTLAMNDKQYQGMVQTRDLLAKHLDHHVDVVPRSQIRDEIGSDFYAGAMVDPAGAGVHVGWFVHGLAAAAVRAGATICEDSEVVTMDRLPDGRHRLATVRGVVEADDVLVATSGYTGALTPWLQRRTVPVGSFIVVTEPLGDEAARLALPHRRQAADNKMLTYYFRLIGDRMLFGGRARFSLSSPNSDLKSAEILKDALAQVFPHLAGSRIDYTWGGLVDISMDRMVHAGVRDGVHYSLGYSGHGVQMATYMGRQLGLKLAGKDYRNVWAGLSYPAVPGHFGPPWFLPFVGAGAKVLDRLGVVV
ncbi:FAD-binding oxidoreductase [Williamsia sp. CHRR-6]|uniref:NAD(P)/FAD-dependent oxidoreductase n=1 Tax=Williamsia sp. CHRR-6 TaxID=2835871 RepID=UPI001BDAC1A9|nr:FAD-binding oxidoreductase [Williamsia sp. CHRR-6]MBT0566809.1 FAD-binding oxidoreductase [Williamsia sp. CHRR-6]